MAGIGMSRALVNIREADVSAMTTAPSHGSPAEPRSIGEAPPGILQELEASAAHLPNAQRTVRARQMVLRAGERLVGVPLITEGWAACISRLPDGRRQILSFLLPGDLVSASAVFIERLPYYVEAITSARCSFYDRGTLGRRLSAEPRMFNELVRLLLSEKERVDQLAVDLGRRDAPGRIARLLLHLRQRLEERGLVADGGFDLPLRQQHIADATGLTSVHVNRVFCAFRQDGIVEMRRGRLTVMDMQALRRRADSEH